MKLLLLSSIIFLVACSASPKLEIHEIPINDAPNWDLVSLVGLETDFRDSFDSNSYGYLSSDEKPILSEYLKFSDYYTVNGKLLLSNFSQDDISRPDMLYLAFSSCNNIRADYERDGGVWKFVGSNQTAITCGRTIPNEDGEAIILLTAMRIDSRFIELAPKVTNYEVSDDGEKLTLVDKNKEPLAVFKRAAES